MSYINSKSKIFIPNQTKKSYTSFFFLVLAKTLKTCTQKLIVLMWHVGLVHDGLETREHNIFDWASYQFKAHFVNHPEARFTLCMFVSICGNKQKKVM